MFPQGTPAGGWTILTISIPSGVLAFFSAVLLSILTGLQDIYIIVVSILVGTLIFGLLWILLGFHVERGRFRINWELVFYWLAIPCGVLFWVFGTLGWIVAGVPAFLFILIFWLIGGFGRNNHGLSA